MAGFVQKESKGLGEKKGHLPGPLDDEILGLAMLIAVAKSSFEGMEDLLEKKGEELSMVERGAEITPDEQRRFAEKEEKRTFSIFYINPAYENAKVEKIESSVEIRFSSLAEEKMSESLGSKNTIPGLEYITYPMIQDLYSKDAMDKIKEYEKIVPIKDADEVELVDRFVTATPERITECVERRERAAKIIEEMIARVDSAIEKTEKGEEAEKILQMLPPITRKMLEVMLKKKKKIDKKVLLKLLLLDRMFLKKMNRIIGSLDVKTLDRIAKTIAESIIKEIKKSI